MAMSVSSRFRTVIVSVLIIALSVPTLVLGPLVVPSSAMLAPADPAASSENLSAQRVEELSNIQRVLEAKMVRQRLADLGLSADEIAAKLSRLSDSQIHQVASQLESVIPGGFHGVDDLLHTMLSILFIVLIVVLILILI
jgi:hypothetical protein